ncbi:MAG: sensor histidine kinase [Jatrophihabitantaceae bacterium]
MTRSAPEPQWLGSLDSWTKSHRWPADVLTTLAVAAVLGSLSLSGAQGMRWRTGWLAVLVVCFAVLHLAVAFRVRTPAIAFAFASAAMLVIVLAPAGRLSSPTAGEPDHVPAVLLPSTLVFLLMLYSVAAYLPVTRSRIALAVALVGAAIATGTSANTLHGLLPDGWLLDCYLGLGFGLAVLVTWNAGRLALVRSQRRMAERVELARLAVLEERARIAREMHDIVAHSLAVIVRQAEGGAFVAERAPGPAAQTLQTIADVGRGALADMRGLLGVLHEPAGSAPQPGLPDLARLVAGVRDTGIDAELDVSGAPFALSAATELAVYRVVQEGLTNAVKYAGPTARVAVHLRWQSGELAVDVADDGGEATTRPVPGAGAGLQGLRDRVDAVGGTFRAGQRGRGFRVQACFPRSATGGVW